MKIKRTDYFSFQYHNKKIISVIFLIHVSSASHTEPAGLSFRFQSPPTALFLTIRPTPTIRALAILSLLFEDRLWRCHSAVLELILHYGRDRVRRREVVSEAVLPSRPLVGSPTDFVIEGKEHREQREEEDQYKWFGCHLIILEATGGEAYIIIIMASKQVLPSRM